MRHHHRDRRCLCGSPELRHGHHRPAARGPRVQGGHHRPAGLARHRGLRVPGEAPPVLRRDRRQHGFHGEPLHLGSQGAQRRRLHTGWAGRQTPRPLRHRVFAADPRSVQDRAHRDRRHRGQPAANRAFRLLVGACAPLHPGGLEGGPAGVRECRAPDRRIGAAPGRGRGLERHHRPARHGVPAQEHAGGMGGNRLERAGRAGGP